MIFDFIGVGSAFTTMDYYHSSILITADSQKKLLIDCGADIRFSLINNNLSSENPNLSPALLIDAVYISHLHSDHIGGLEWLALNTYFSPKKKKPKLFSETVMMDKLWNNSLKGGLGCITNKIMTLSDYFTCMPIPENGSFLWEEINFTLLKVPHILAGTENIYSHGLLITDIKSDNTVFISTDTQFQPDIITKIAETASLLFHDCETTSFKTGIHTHYDELLTLPKHIRKKMWLYHYQPDHPQQPEKDGFKGFVSKGQKFNF